MHIFISATDVNIGKNFICAGLSAIMQSLGYKTGVFKPIEVGAIEKNNFLISDKLAFIKKLDPYIETRSSYTFKTKAVPCLCSEIEKIKIEKQKIIKDFKKLFSICDCTLTEGTGGIRTPFCYDFDNIELIKTLNLPVILVTNANESSLNQTILTLNTAAQEKITINGVIINKIQTYSEDFEQKSMPRLIEEYTNAKVIGIVRDFGDISKIFPSVIIDNLLNSIDIEKAFGTKIPKLL